ncbi:MAG: hypothetical protein IJ527_01660 [Prevotella sp.]|nr:hypothetical protein [Prevotella sp.]
MKRMILTAGLALTMLTAMAQDSYIVKTKNVKKVAVTTANTAVEGTDETPSAEEEPKDFVGKNFKYHSLCEWRDGMRFMVLPEKYDLLVNTFRDAGTGKEVPSGKLRYKIMVYKGHSTTSDNHDRINFVCQDDNKAYYYQIPNGTFDDYCYGKMGVPTLAYLDDVDKARELLLGQSLFTKQKTFFIDTQADGDGFEEVTVEKQTEVKVTAVGVGTRSYPVKIIVEDVKTGKEFYMNCVMSRTNNGMRDDELIMDNAKHVFANSFDLISGTEEVSGDIAQYVGKVVYSKIAMAMTTKGAGKEREVQVPRLTEFKIDAIYPITNSQYVTLALVETESRRQYTKDVTFEHISIIGDVDGQQEAYFGTLFGIGEGKLRNTTTATRALIRAGRVAVGMTEDEVLLSVGEPDSTASSSNGRYDWIYKRSNGKLLIVQFGKTGKVIGTKVSK